MKETLQDSFILTRLYNTHWERGLPTDEEELSPEGTSLIPTALINCRVSAMSGERRMDNFLFHDISIRNTLQPVNMKITYTGTSGRSEAV